MTLTLIVLLIITGIIFVLVEMFFIPGISIAAVAGAACIIMGIYYAFAEYGQATGWFVVIGTSIVLVTLIVLAFRSNTWKKVSLNKSIDGKIDPLKESTIKVGDVGKTASRLAPMGRVKINNIEIEAKSQNGFIDQKTEIIVTKILNTYIIVKPNS